MDDKQRMRGLIDKLNEASRRYYDQNESDISDDEWDADVRRTACIGRKNGRPFGRFTYAARGRHGHGGL